MKTLSIIAAFLLLGITASYAINTNKSDSSKNAYTLAKQEIEKMLDGRSQLNYEKAIYWVENAWYNNKLDKENYINTINGHEEIVLKIMLNNWHPPKDTVDNFGQRVDRTESYAKAVANWAIFKYMTDSVHFKDGSLHAPYQYSIKDPFGSNDWTNTQVSNLDKTGQGNCFALSSMFKILSDRIGSEATLCTAPSHIYINHADENGIRYNVEVGSRDFPGTGTISTLTYSTTESIRNDITLRDLDDKQAVALCLVYLAKGYEHKFGTKTDDFVLGCANTTLKYDDHNLNAMLLKAEVLETRLAMQRRPIAQLQTDKTFLAYESLIAKLYRLGYREIPKNMKNLLVRTYTMDSVRAMQGRVYDGKTRYASLSWGMFDEAHDIKPTELYGHTVFNTVTKKIDGFTKPVNSYNSYNFDPIVFALNVDPLTHKFPNMSPYNAMDNNPIAFKDPNGENAEFAITGNTITITTNIYILGAGATKEKAMEIKNEIMKSFEGKKSFTENDKTYNIKFEVNVKTVEDLHFTDLLNPANNYIGLKSDEARSHVDGNGQTGVWKLNPSENDHHYAHETGHLLGLDDGYFDVEDLNHLEVNTETRQMEGRKIGYNFPSTDKLGKDALMGTGGVGKIGVGKMKGKYVDEIAKKILSQKTKKGIINAAGAPFVKPTLDDKKYMQKSGGNIAGQ